MPPVWQGGKLRTVKYLNALKRSGCGFRTYRRAVMILVFLGLTACFLLPGWAASSSNYDPLRLYTEALFEITQKYVWPRKEDDLIYGSLRGMMNSLDPEYQSYLHGEKSSPADAGLVLIVKDNLLTVASVIDDSPASRAGLKPGDHILKIDDKPVHNLTTQEAMRRFQGAAEKKINLQVLRNGEVKPLDVTVTLAPLGTTTVAARYLDHTVAYVRISYFNNETPVELDTALKNIQKHQPPVQGLVLDLRNNARGTMEEAVRSTSLLLGDQKILIAKGRSPDSEESFAGKERDQVFKKLPPMVVLVDHGTARAAEIMAGALQSQARVTLLGTKTLGLCGLTKTFQLEDGSALVMTVAQCYTPKGAKIQGKGLDPEVPGATPKEEVAKEKAPGKALTPEQDPWVQQAVGLLTSGKSPAALKKAS
jgi:carboxyl-terminal processing protease